MSRGLNKVFLIGNVGSLPEVRYLPSGKPVANFSIATSFAVKRDDNCVDETEWHRCVAFDKTAETVGKYIQKGTKVHVEGRLKTEQWEKDGVKHSATKIIISWLLLLDKVAQNDDKVAEVQDYSNNRTQPMTVGKSGELEEKRPQAHSDVVHGPDDDIPF